MIEREVVDVCEVLKACWPKVFKMVYCEAIRASSTRVTAVPDGPQDCLRGEWGDVGVKRAFLKEASLDVSGGGVVCMWDN